MGRFGSVFDSGFLHLLDEEESDRFIDDLASALVPGGRYYLHEFAVEFPVENVPRAVTKVELRTRFARPPGGGSSALAPRSSTARSLHRWRQSSLASNGCSVLF